MIVTSTRLHTVVDADGAAILDVQGGLISTLNATGAFVWQRLERGETREAIVAELARETGEAHITVERDVCDFIEDLTARRLLS